MSDQEVIYSSVKVLQSLSDSQNHRLNLESTRGPGKIEHKEYSMSWHLIAVTLGILCLLLLITVMVLGIKGKYKWDEIPQNQIQRCDMKNYSYLMEQRLLNKTLEYDILKNEALQQKKEWNACLTEKNICHRKNSLSKCLKNTGVTNGGNWSCCGVSCYYFTTEKTDWNGCKQTCEMYNLSLLKIDDDDEKAFIQPQAHPHYYWIGLSYNDQENKWKWIDNDLSSGCTFKILNLTSSRGKCAVLTSTRIDNFDCSYSYNCICEMMMLSLLQKTIRKKQN